MLEIKHTFLILVAAALLAVPAVAADQSARLAPLQNVDLAASELVEIFDKARPDVSREDVSFTFPMTADKALELRPAPFEAASREYFVDVSGAELRRGDIVVSLVHKGVHTAIQSAEQLNKVLAALDKNAVITLQVRRGDSMAYVTVNGLTDKG